MRHLKVCSFPTKQVNVYEEVETKIWALRKKTDVVCECGSVVDHIFLLSSSSVRFVFILFVWMFVTFATYANSKRMYVWLYICMYVCSWYPRSQEEEEPDPSQLHLQTAMWVLGTDPRPSQRASGALNQWSFSSLKQNTFLDGFHGPGFHL